MKKIGIIVDSSSGIKNGEYEGVHVLPLAVTLKDKNDKSKITVMKDGVDCDEVKVCNYIKEGYDICTSQSSIGEITQIIEKLYDDYDRIYVLPIATTLSQSYNTWRLIAEDYPKILPLQQYDVSHGLRWTIEDLIKMRDAGTLNDESVQKYLDEIVSKRIGILFVYDVKQLKKGGRVSNFKSMIISMFGLKICITLNKDGLLFFDKASSLNKSIDVAFEACNKQIKDFDINKIKRIGLIYSPTYEHKEEVDKAFEYLINEKLKGIKYDLSKAFMPGVICCHTGPFCAAVYFEIK